MSSPFIPNWSPTAYYVLGDNVFYIDTRYRLIVAGSTPGLLGVPPPDNPAGWEVFNTGVISLGDDVEPPIDGNVILIGGPGIGILTDFPQNGITITNTATGTPFSYNYYVSSISGNDTTGSGTITQPWATIGRALTVAATIPDTNQVSIILAAGVYIENVNITRANTFISGSATSLSTSTLIAGSVTVDLTASVLPFIIGGLSSVQVQRINYNNSVGNSQSYLVTDCFIVPLIGSSAIVMTDTSPGGTGDLTIQSCLIYMSDTVAITNSNGFLTLVNTEVKNNIAAPASPLSMITTSGTGRVNMFGCIITQSSTLSTVSPIVNLTNNATTASMTFYNSTIQYTSTASDTGTGAKCCIRCSNSATINPIVIFNCLLLCQGATTFVTPGQILVLQRTGVGATVVSFGQNSGGTTANHLPPNGGGFTKVALVNVT